MKSLTFQGRLLAICLAAEPAAPMFAVDEVAALAGVGLQGDRYALRQEHFKRNLPDIRKM